jgi:hypothetical protein
MGKLSTGEVLGFHRTKKQAGPGIQEWAQPTRTNVHRNQHVVSFHAHGASAPPCPAGASPQKVHSWLAFQLHNNFALYTI